jgi:predicted transcriptional regulator
MEMIFILSDLTIVQVAIKVIVDNFTLLNIEYCFLDGLSDILSPDTVMRLNEKLIKEIAAEIEDSQTEKARTLRKLRSLEAGLQTLNRFGRHKIVGR